MKNCKDVAYFPNSKSFVISTDTFSHLVETNDLFISNVSKALEVDKGQAIKQISDFFVDKPFLVQQTGVQGGLYRLGTFAQTAGAASMLSRTLAFSKAAGVGGLIIIQAQPLILVALPSVGAMFFHGCGTLLGNTTYGRTCNTVGNILNLPMAGVELIYNVYGAPIVNATFGIPTILNYTKQAKRGIGLDTKEALDFICAAKKPSILGTIKCYIIEKLGGECL
jgi:hypothetical protein